MKTLALALPLLCGAARAVPESTDYIIVGAGTAGLVIANRLSEDSAVTVTVVEPGTDQRNNPNVTDPTAFSLAFGTPIDWQYKTTAQPGVGDRELQIHQGKAWGGTSTINGELRHQGFPTEAEVLKSFFIPGMTYIRGEVAQFDAWEKLGNQGWNWDALVPYYIKSEQYIAPSETQIAAGATYQEKYHGFEGPLHVSYIPDLVNGNFSEPVIQSWESLSMPHNPDLNSGHPRGLGMGPQTLDPAMDRRWDAAQAYYYPVEDRPNLKIVQGTVSRVLWEEDDSKRRPRDEDLVVASGVEFLTGDGEKVVLNANKEVILSAGAIRTPQVLESSGVGNPRFGAEIPPITKPRENVLTDVTFLEIRILKSLGIETKVDLPSVGENVGEQANHVIGYTGELGAAWSAYHTFLTAPDIFGSDFDAVKQSTLASLSEWAQATVDASGDDALNVTAVEKLMRVQYELIFEKHLTFAEILTVIIPESHASNYWVLLPFSRGSVHLGSADEINNPLIDPRFFRSGIDLSATVATGKMVQKFWLSESINKFLTERTQPSLEVLPEDATDEQWEVFTQGTREFCLHLFIYIFFGPFACACLIMYGFK